MSFKIWVTPAAIINIDLCNYLYADGSGNVTVSATATEAVNTNVSVYWTWVGDLSSIVTGTTTISSGDSFGTSTVGGAFNDEYFSDFTTLYYLPVNSPPQIYTLSVGGCY
jgi:hypothetical protein